MQASTKLTTYLSVSTGPLSSIGSPITLIILPSVSGPTGIVMGPPVSLHFWPLTRPSVPSIAMVRTVFSPNKMRVVKKICTIQYVQQVFVKLSILRDRFHMHFQVCKTWQTPHTFIYRTATMQAKRLRYDLYNNNRSWSRTTVTEVLWKTGTNWPGNSPFSGINKYCIFLGTFLDVTLPGVNYNHLGVTGT